MNEINVESPAAPVTPEKSELAPTVPATRKHHKYGPSRLGYLRECAAFTSHSGTSEAAEEGTFLHDVMENMIAQVKNKRYKTTLEQMPAWVVKTYEFDDPQIQYLRFACKKVDAFLAKNPTAIYTEIDVKVTDPDTGEELNHGFLDVLFVFGDTGILLDFKFGWIPVTHASKNLQGFNYTLGCFQAFPFLNRIGICFCQPKLNLVTEHMVERRQFVDLYRQIKEVIARAEFVQANPDKAQQFMKPGGYCDYCTLAGTCTVLANHQGRAVAHYQGLPLPPSFKGLELSKPEDLALARYWVDVIEQGFDGLKRKAFEVARENGGSIQCTLPNGEVITWEVQSRGADRVLGSAPEVADVLKDFVAPEEILGAADLAITKLEPIVKNAMVELARAEGRKLTKKAAWEQIQSTLEAHGLLSRPDTKIEFLKQTKQVKQIKE